jgi:NSS family neurotransmitter:Na+ symporter
VLFYLVYAVVTGFADVDAVASKRVFDTLTGHTSLMMFWTFVALGIAGVIVARGVSSGIEKAVVVLMPLLFLLLVSLALFNAFAGGMPEALAYLFAPDFSNITAEVLLAAVGQAFFSIGVAMAGMMMFGAYLDKSISIAGSAFVIVIADTAVALAAGLVIFPMVFEHGLDPAGGAGLIFQTLPVAFAQMPGGAIIAPLFFLLLSVAAVTSIVGLVEPVTAWVSEAFGLVRTRATATLVVAVLSLSFVSALSYNEWANVSLFGLSLSAFIDFLPNQIMLPLGGLAIAIFAGWFLSRRASLEELGLQEGVFSLWFQLLRFVVVPALLLIFIGGLI